ncbi:ATP-binding cassette domain-containing protein [Candidatus Aerophobetes bacterium]|nr:ATP-binding cassette domain-containing protein [Candidatus Aerophobetes bacterium]
MIEVKGLTKYYGRIKAIEDLTFEIEKGEIVGLLGPNGAGKTTCMRILTCIFPPTRGTAKIAGIDITKNPLEVKKYIGYLPETNPLYPDMTVLSYLKFVASAKVVKKGKIKKEIRRVVYICEIGNVKKRLIANLSKGYRQRVGLAQALIGDPPVLILDEPTIGLDPTQTFEFRNLIKSMQGKKTVILSTHILPEVSMTCQKVIIINKGKIIAQDTPENLSLKLQKSAQIYAEIEGPAEKVTEVLSNLPGVKKVNVERKIEDNLYGYLIETEKEKQIRKEIVSHVVKSGWSLLEIRPVSMGLEDVFVNLVTQEKNE